MHVVDKDPAEPQLSVPFRTLPPGAYVTGERNVPIYDGAAPRLPLDPDDETNEQYQARRRKQRIQQRLKDQLDLEVFLFHGVPQTNDGRDWR